MLPRSAFAPRRSNSGKQHEGKRAPAFLQWLRGRRCLVENDSCYGRIEAAHVRTGTDGGTGLKPSDRFAVPLCSHHHQAQHGMGEASFETAYRVQMLSAATEYWRVWPGRSKWEASQ